MRLYAISAMLLSMQSEVKNYELAYLLAPSLSEEEMLSRTHEITALIESQKGVVRHVEVPKKRLLSYPVRKMSHACFGWTTFAVSSAGAVNIGKELNGFAPFLRHLLLEEEEVRAGRPMPFFSRTQTPAGRRPVSEQQPPERLDLEALDKKLEEILGQ